MYIYMGPYKKYYGTYWLSRKLLFWEKHDSDAVEKLSTFMNKTWISDIFDWIDSYRSHRKMVIRIDDYDAYNADQTFARIAVPLLNRVKQDKQGSPYVDDEDVPIELRTSSAKPLTKQEKEMGVVDEHHHKRWEYVLNEMIYAFEQYSNDSFEDYTDEDTRAKNGLRLFSKYYSSLWT